ncbi:5516_t:CDS:2, partial [Scutellospora calospora]
NDQKYIRIYSCLVDRAFTIMPDETDEAWRNLMVSSGSSVSSEEDSFVVKTVAQSYNNINFGAIDQSFNSISNHFSSQPRPMHPTSDIRHTSLSVVMSPTETSSPIQANNTIYIGQSQMQDQHSNVILPSTSTQPQQVSYFGKVPVQDQRTNSIPSLHQSIYQNNQSTNMVVDDYKFKAKALYDYHGSPEDNSELSFNKDEYLDIASKEGKWWRARKSDGTTGIAPSNYKLTNCDLSRKKARRGGSVFDEVWDHVSKGEKVNPGHYKAKCFHCGKCWQRGNPYILRSHLALHCQDVPEDIR